MGQLKNNTVLDDLPRPHRSSSNSSQQSSRKHSWKTFLPLHFAFNNINYTHYGLYYTYILVNIEQFYPSLKELISKEGLSVQGQEKYPLRTATDQRGEKTIN